MKAQKTFYILCIIVFSGGIVGCEKISALFGSSASKKIEQTPSPQAPPTQSQGEPSITPQASTNEKGLPPNALARVGSWTLTLEDFKQKLTALKEAAPEYDINDKESKKLVLEELVRQQLLVMDAQQSGLDSKKEIVDAVEEFKRTLLVREAATKIVDGIAVTEQDALDYYNQNKEAFAEPSQWHIREIIVFTQNGAKDIQIELLQGADFATVAKERSKGKSATSGGDLGLLNEFPFPQMESAVTPLNVGDISGVFKGPEGYYIVKLEEKKGGTPVDFAKAKEDIINGLTLMKQQKAILDYIAQLEQKTSVQVNEALLQE